MKLTVTQHGQGLAQDLQAKLDVEFLALKTKTLQELLKVRTEELEHLRTLMEGVLQDLLINYEEASSTLLGEITRMLGTDELSARQVMASWPSVDDLRTKFLEQSALVLQQLATTKVLEDRKRAAALHQEEQAQERAAMDTDEVHLGKLIDTKIQQALKAAKLVTSKNGPKPSSSSPAQPRPKGATPGEGGQGSDLDKKKRADNDTKRSFKGRAPKGNGGKSKPKDQKPGPSRS